MSPSYLLKIVTVGAASVGKTSIIIRYSTGTFREHYSPTLGVGFAYKKMDVDEDSVVVFMYDVTSWESLNEVIEWKKEVDRNLDDYRAILVGNKSDLAMERVVSTEEGQKIASQMGIDHIETSVRLDMNVNTAFEMIARAIIASFH
jgi:GTPase SAR1 family protein